MTVQTLSELKAENAKLEEAEAAKVEAVPQTEEIEAEEVDESEAVEGVEEEAQGLAESSDDDTTKPEIESWMQSEADDSQESNDASDIPSHTAKAMRLKYQAKTERVKDELGSEIAALKAQVEALTANPAKNVPNGKPKRDDFLEHDDPDEKYFDAMFEWRNANQANEQANHAQVAQQQEFVKQQSVAVDAHYSRAEQLAKANKIDAEVYQRSDLSVRTAISDDVAEALISKMGPGSEKVMFNLGRNPQRLNKLQTMLKEDPTGLSAMGFLGELKAELTPPKRKTNAPAPARTAKGGANTSVPGKAMLKKYQAAHKSKNMNEAFSIRRAAKKAGVNTSDW